MARACFPGMAPDNTHFPVPILEVLAKKLGPTIAHDVPESDRRRLHDSASGLTKPKAHLVVLISDHNLRKAPGGKKGFPTPATARHMIDLANIGLGPSA